MQEGGDEEALAFAARATAANPHAAIVRRHGLAHLHAGQIELAVTLLDRSMRLSPNDPSCFSAWTGLALALLALGRDEEAVIAARKAVQFNASSCEALRVLAASLALANRTEEARAALAHLLELDPAGAAVTGFGTGLRDAVAARVLKGLRRAGAMLPDDGPADDDRTTIRHAGSRFQPERILLVSRPGETDREVTLGGTPLVLGRAPESSIVLNDPKVSRAHCRIALSQGDVIATDPRSTNGTLIDQRRIEGAVRLRPGSLLHTGFIRYNIAIVNRPIRTARSSARHSGQSVGTARNPEQNRKSGETALPLSARTGRDLFQYRRRHIADRQALLLRPEGETSKRPDAPNQGRFVEHRGAPGMSRHVPKPGAADALLNSGMAAPVPFFSVEAAPTVVTTGEAGEWWLGHLIRRRPAAWSKGGQFSGSGRRCRGSGHGVSRRRDDAGGHVYQRRSAPPRGLSPSLVLWSRLMSEGGHEFPPRR